MRRTPRHSRLLRLAALATVASATALTIVYLRPSPPARQQPPTTRDVPGRAKSPIASPAREGATFLSFADARPALERHGDALPAALAGKSIDELEPAWPEWAALHDRNIRARLARGDEDSLVNLWHYGTTFTPRPRLIDRDVVRRGGRGAVVELLEGRLDDLVAAFAAPGDDERLQFGREVLARHGIDLVTAAGRDRARDFLIDAREHVLADNTRYTQTARAASQEGGHAASTYATLYRDRGLSSDTSLAAAFAIDRAIDTLARRGHARPASVPSIAIVGPGLDFADKAEGYDFYPPQSIQPFAVDSLLRSGLLNADSFEVVTLDLSPRVNRHLDAALPRAGRGQGYLLHLPLDGDRPGREWLPELVDYCRQFGDRTGEAAATTSPPPGVDVRVRAVRISPSHVSRVTPTDVNIVVQHLQPTARNGRFDLLVAIDVMPVFWDHQRNGDTLYAYRRQQAR